MQTFVERKHRFFLAEKYLRYFTVGIYNKRSSHPEVGTQAQVLSFEFCKKF